LIIGREDEDMVERTNELARKYARRQEELYDLVRELGKLKRELSH
jgi:hypothetical protein